jgi:hypothetical protein
MTREEVANALISIQEDLPSEGDRAVLGYAAHYLRAPAQTRNIEPISQDSATIAQTALVIINRLTKEIETLRETIREECATICDQHAEWAESKIEDGDDPASPTSQMWDCMSNTANDLAEMIRKDLPPMSSTHNTVAEPSRCKNPVTRGESKESDASTGDVPVASDSTYIIPIGPDSTRYIQIGWSQSMENFRQPIYVCLYDRQIIKMLKTTGENDGKS